VLTGKVWVGLVKNVNAKKAEDMKLEQKVVLLPNDKVVLQVAGQVFTQSKVADAQTTTDWQKGYLLFDQTPMADVAEALHRAYGIQVELQNPDIANCKLFGRFPKDQPVERQMEYIAGVTGTMYEKKNDSTYLLKGEGCRP
jgi:ferric-dicitrate binding protein FerR (iron transport regulator)